MHNFLSIHLIKSNDVCAAQVYEYQHISLDI